MHPSLLKIEYCGGVQAITHGIFCGYNHVLAETSAKNRDVFQRISKSNILKIRTSIYFLKIVIAHPYSSVPPFPPLSLLPTFSSLDLAAVPVQPPIVHCPRRLLGQNPLYFHFPQ
jgi:hypothetical protein